MIWQFSVRSKYRQDGRYWYQGDLSNWRVAQDKEHGEVLAYVQVAPFVATQWRVTGRWQVSCEHHRAANIKERLKEISDEQYIDSGYRWIFSWGSLYCHLKNICQKKKKEDVHHFSLAMETGLTLNTNDKCILPPFLSSESSAEG